MKALVIFAMLLWMVTGSAYAADSTNEDESAQQTQTMQEEILVAQCSEAGTANGLQGEELDTYIATCIQNDAANQTKDEG